VRRSRRIFPEAGIWRAAASPAFNYTYRRQDAVVKFGFTVSLVPPALQ
jgi:hypothetical protein